MKKTEILKISSPSNIWIAEKNSLKFTNLISEYIQKEIDVCSYDNFKLDEESLNGKRLVAFQDTQTNKWYRARITSEFASFRSNCLSLYLIDSGDKITIPRNTCKRINNETIQIIPPLATSCALYGVIPSDGQDWSSGVSRFIAEMKKNSTEIYVKKVHENQSKIYLKLKSNEKINFDSYIVSLNDLLVENKFANFIHESKSKLQNEISKSSSYGSIPNFYFRRSLRRYTKDYEKYCDEFDNFTVFEAMLKSSVNSLISKFTRIDTPSPANETNILNSSFRSSCSRSSTIIDDEKLTNQFSDILKIENYVKNPAQMKPIHSNIIQTNPYFLLQNVPVSPVLNTKDPRIHQSIRDYLNLNGTNNISNLDSYFWACILHGLHTFYMPADDSTKISPNSFVCPLLSILLEKTAFTNKMNFERGFIKKSMAQGSCNNGPILLIVCASSENAQKVYEIVNQIIQIDSRTSGKEKIKSLMIQGGGNEDQYDVPLLNGVDVLIAATPFCLLRALGESKTNLERLKYLVFDESYLLLEKFPFQIKTLMEIYTDLIKINESPFRAQFILVSNFWSTKLRSFIERFLIRPSFIIGNKLEASFYGQTNHSLKDLQFNPNDKSNYMVNILNNNRDKNVLVCANTIEKAIKLHDHLSKKYQVDILDVVTHQTRPNKIDRIEKKYLENEHGLILVIEQQMLDKINVDNIRCVINYDFPATKTAYAARLWTMRKYFNTETKSTPVENLDNLEPNMRSTPLNESIKDEMKLELNNEHLMVVKESERLKSYLLLTNSSGSYTDSLYNFLTRIGYKKGDFPDGFLKMVDECRLKKEEAKKDYPLCPYIKTFGSCMNINPTSCKYRHTPNRKVDRMEFLDKDLKIPSEGFVRFKISFVRDPNNFYVNILGHQNLNQECEVVYDRFKKLDMEMQLYFSDLDNVKFATKFRESDLYAYKDTATSIFKRIKIEEVIKKDGTIAFELIVKCIDYGPKLKISTQDLIKLPDEFKELPPQAVEVYLCDLRPIEKDLTWSVSSRSFMSDRLLKHKEFIGKIQLGAGSALWLHPISSYKHLKTLDLLIREDSLQSELISNNYGVSYPLHLKKLRKLFEDNGVFVPSLEDETVKLKRNSNEFYEIFYDLKNSKELDFKPSISFLNKDSYLENKVYVSCVRGTLEKIYVQLEKFYDNLENLNDGIRDFIRRIDNVKDKHKIIGGRRLNDDEKEHLDENALSDLKYWERTILVREKLNKKVFDYLKSICKKFYCLIRFGSDYNRGEILEIMDDGQVKVFFVDYGDRHVVEIEDIYPIVPKYIRLLPFQAIECSIENIEPNREDSTVWSEEAISYFLSLTRDDDDRYYKLFAQVLDSFDSKYSIYLFKKSYPEFIDLSYEMVSSRNAKLKINEEKKIFPFLNETEEESNRFLNHAKQFVDVFIRDNDVKKQEQFLQVLEFRAVYLYRKSRDEIISLGLIQCLAKGMAFLKDLKQSIRILMFIRKNFLMRKNDNHEFLKIFVDNSGFSNVMRLVYENKDKDHESINFCLNFIIDSFAISDYVKYFVLDNKNYVKCLWAFIEIFKQDDEKLKKCLDLIQELIDVFDAQVHFEEELITFIYNIVQKIKLWINETTLDRLNDYYETFKSKEIIEEEEPSIEELAIFDSDDKNKVDENNNHELDKNVELIEDRNQSEIDEFIDFFEDLFLNKMKSKENTVTQKEFENQWAPRKDYLYPKCVWGQDNENIYFKILLKGVKECRLDFSSNSISFRCQLNDKTYGLDLILYAEIEEQINSGPENDYFKIVLKKKIKATWIRLLSTVNKPNFIKSEYDNTYDSSEENDEKKKFRKYMDEMNASNGPKNIGKITLESPENSEYDSESDFEDRETDFKEKKDYRWD